MVAYPLKASANGRYLADQNNQPFLLCGDSAWSLESQLSNADIDLYLKDRATRGFNAILFEVIEHKFADHAPNNIDNVAPFTSTNFTTPNSTYFNRIDHILSAAASYGICCLMFPLYLGFGFSDEGWSTEVAASNTAAMQSWADYLATRYSASDNLIWVIGGDVNPGGNATVQARASDFATRLAASDTRHLITAHNARGNTAQSQWPSATWLTLNTTYTDQLGSPGGAQSAYSLAGPMPFIQIENYYEGEHSSTAQQVRSQAYWTVLGGGSGAFMGNDPMWYFSSTTGSTFGDGSQNADWKQDLNSAAARDWQNWRKWLIGRQWHNLVPDSSHAIVTAGYGTLGGADFVGAAQSADKSLVMAYIPTGATITVAMSKLPGVTRARWYDPTNGVYQDVSGQPFMNDGSRTFSAPGTNNAGAADWALVLEALDPGMPGSWKNV